MTLEGKIKEVKFSIAAIGILQPSDQVQIVGSAFSVDDNGGLLSAAHLFKNLKEETTENLAAMIPEKNIGKLIRYRWTPIEVEKREDGDDLALLRLKNAGKTLLKPLHLSNPKDLEQVQEGQGVYFIGFPYATELIRDGFGVSLIVNSGIISSVKRKSAPPNLLDWFIVDAISNPGNSGCPLISIETNRVIGIMSIAFRRGSRVMPALDIREPMHIAGAKPVKSNKILQLRA